jgi:hypothetical protein
MHAGLTNTLHDLADGYSIHEVEYCAAFYPFGAKQTLR